MGRNEKKNKVKEQPAKKNVTVAAATPAQSRSDMTSHFDLPFMASGDLVVHDLTCNLKIHNFSVQICGRSLIANTSLELNQGSRYGLIGYNGSGKSIMLKSIGLRLVPIPDHIQCYILDQEVPASDFSALDAILSELDIRTSQLEAEIEQISLIENDPNIEERMQKIYSELDELDPDSSRIRAKKILHGLGFTEEMQQKKCKDYSGGWRMRIALAKALFIKPDLLLLDEPTNHLDLEACVWLEQYLKNYNRILLLVSHSQDFLNEVCNNTIHIYNGQLIPYSGNYDQYVKTRSEKEENQMKRYYWEQDQIKHIKEYIGRFGSGNAKMASQAKSKEKVLAKLEDKGLTERVIEEKVLSFHFPSCGILPPPVLSFNDVSFGYSADKVLYRKLDFGVDLDSRIALVGPNGVGKSTLLKLMTRKLVPLQGQVTCHQHLKIGYYNQHLSDQLDENLSPLEYMIQKFDMEPQAMRRVIGRFGITGRDQTSPIKILSDGIKSRVVFAELSFKAPHLLLLDEPTNHLDMESIDALGKAIQSFEGGLVLVSHDFRLINQVAKEIWICTPQGVLPFNGDITQYKLGLIDKITSEESL